MRFKNHFELDGKHAFLGASKYHWIRYDSEKMERIWANKFASEKGQRLHKFAAEAIRLGIRMTPNEMTLNSYVNDAIRYRMTPELALFYNDDCFGTPDALSFNKSILRIHDLKTGIHPGSFDQPRIYCALFCLEYDINPYDIEMIMRLYQSDQIFEEIADPSEIKSIMDKVIVFTKRIDEMREVML